MKEASIAKKPAAYIESNMRSNREPPSSTEAEGVVSLSTIPLIVDVWTARELA
jgi:hypothetical protein